VGLNPVIIIGLGVFLQEDDVDMAPEEARRWMIRKEEVSHARMWGKAVCAAGFGGQGSARRV
jgi:hypothetical protein